MLGTKCNFGAAELQSETIKKRYEIPMQTIQLDEFFKWILQDLF